jgi:alpha-amylase
MTVRRTVVACVAALAASCLAVTGAGPAFAAGGVAVQGHGGSGGHGHGPGHGPTKGAEARHSLRAPSTNDDFYFVMADRFENGDTDNDEGGLGNDPLVSGFDPTKKGFYNGGDLAGILQKLDYIQGLGTTAIWLTPSFKNKAVQLEDGPSAGYHGYWITDFTQIDPHLGTNAQLKQLVDQAHSRGIKVFFDIITNHTADVIGYQEGARRPYISKDASPYRTAAGRPFDDRDYAGKANFPAMDPATSFPYHPVLDPGEENLKVPAWLNDLSLYHNRGDTTFVGENSQYGDFFGLDDLFTENPRVVNGMIDVYGTWIRNFGIDGFRIDTMKHVNDEFWQKFGPAILKIAKQAGKSQFFMFGEVFDTSRSYTSHFTTTDKSQAVLDFPFQAAARDYASKGGAASALRTFFDGDDWYTDADSNVYQLPTFLGNHDMGRIGGFIQADNPGSTDAEQLARDELAHSLMYLSRGNPVVYYGDEQGFTGGTAGDQAARQTLFASQVPDYLDDDLIGTSSTHAVDNFVPTHPLYQTIKDLSALTKIYPALRNGAHQNRYAADGPGVYAFSRIDRADKREYVVAVNNAETAQSASVPTYARGTGFTPIYGDGAGHPSASVTGALSVRVPALSVVVYRADARIPVAHRAPAVTLRPVAPSTDTPTRLAVVADVAGTGFAEVSFEARVVGKGHHPVGGHGKGHGKGHAKGGWQPVGTDDTAPYRVFHDVSGLASGTKLEYRAVALDLAGHTSRSSVRKATVPAPALTIQSPAEGAKARDSVTVTAVADPERATNVVSFQRSVDGGQWTTIGTDSSSPVYTAVDDISGLALAAGTPIAYRAKLFGHGVGGTVTSAVRHVVAAGPPATVATLHYFRPGGDYTGWGLHLWGDAVDPAVLAQVAWDHPWPATRVEGGWAEYDIALVDDTKPVNFIMHLPSGDSVPSTREPGGDRSFVPIDSNDVYIVQGDPTVYTTPPPTP